VILSLAAALGTATFLESLYDTPTAQYYVYRASWFHGLLGLLGLNIFSVAMSRFPWKKRHIPFLLAHLGILILLMGSWITERAGIDGNLRISEGETESVVELDHASVLVSDNTQLKSIPIPWLPPGVEFHAIDSTKFGIPYDFKIDRFLSHADANVSFVADSARHSGATGASQSAAIQLKVVGGPMGISEKLWLWEGAPAWKVLQAGPAQFSIGQVVSEKGRPSLSFLINQDSSVSYQAMNSSGQQMRGRLSREHLIGAVIHPGWRGGVTVTITDWIAQAIPSTTYQPARVQYGNQAPSSAIHLVTSESEGLWLGLGDRAVLRVRDREVEIAYLPRRLVLPFSVHLDRFTVDHDPGTFNPAAYSSDVTVRDAQTLKKATIAMNEPLEHRGFTLYQASYEDAMPRPVTSIFTVNRDPGRPWKYLGSLLIVIGSVLLFASKMTTKTTTKITKTTKIGGMSVGKAKVSVPQMTGLYGRPM
jgi:hypothetical protein